MKNARVFVGLAVLLGLLGLAALLGSMGGGAAVAAPAAIPTPLSVTPGNGAPQVAPFWRATALTASGAGAETVVAGEKVDLQWVIDQATVNTVTLKLQFSNDSTNWVDGATFVTNNAADAGDMQQHAVFGRYLRAYATVVNTNPVTITVIGLVK
jgi:hypothetical protein